VTGVRRIPQNVLNGSFSTLELRRGDSIEKNDSFSTLDLRKR